jgi:hypothetical protein
MHESNDFLFYFFLLNGLQRLDREEEVFHTLMIESQRPPNLGGGV